MSFNNFANQNRGLMALQYTRSLLSNPDLTLGELKDALSDPDFEPYLSITLGAVSPDKPAPKKRPHQYRVNAITVEDRITAVLQGNPKEGFTVAELLKEIDVSGSVLRRALETLVADPNNLLFCRERDTDNPGKNPLEYLWMG